MTNTATPDQPRQLHHLLKAAPTNPEPIDVCVNQSAEGAVTISAHGQTLTTPFLQPQDAQHALAILLSHYPAPAAIDGNPVERTPFIPFPNLFQYNQTPGFTRVTQRRTSETINHAGIHSGIIHTEGLTYVYGGAAMMTAAVPATPPPDQGFAFTKAQFLEISPNITLTPQQAAVADYVCSTSAMLFICHPPPGAADEQIAGQIQEVNRLAQETAPWAERLRWSSGFTRTGSSPEEAGLHRIWTPDGNGAWIIPQQGQTAAWPDSEAPQAAVQSLTRALLQNPQTGITPAEKGRNNQTIVKLRQAAIAWPDGETAVFDADQLEDGVEFPGHPDHIFGPERAVAQSITITARLQVPGQPEQDLPLPADMLILGHSWENTTFITPDHPHYTNPAAIAELEVEALWSADDEEHYRDPQALKDHLATWWTRVFQGDETAFQRELNNLAGNFHHQCPEPEGARTALSQGPNGASITWRPRDAWDWLDPVIRQYVPQAGAADLKRITEAAQRRLQQECPEALHLAVQESL